MFDNDGPDVTSRTSERRDAATFMADLVTAAGFLTRVPVGAFVIETRRLNQAMATFPLVGLIVGCCCALALLAADGLGLGLLAAAAVAVGCHVLVTGGLHEDGLADTADGFWGGGDPQRRLAIMRDSSIGTYGVLALVIAVLIKCALIAEIAGASIAGAALTLAAAGALSRHAMVAVLAANEPARSDGLAFAAGKPSADTRRLSLLIAIAVAVPVLWWAEGFLCVLLSLLLAQGAVAGMAVLARRRIGGYTGDVLGAVQQVSEIAVLAGAAMAG